VGDRARLGHVDRVARGLQPGRDDVAELDELADLAVAGDLVDPVVVPIGDQEPAAVGLQRVLDSGRDVELNFRGGLLKANVPMSVTTVKLSGPSIR
jgi:hypothetical protein